MVAENLERHQDGHGHERADHAPDPSPQQHRQKDHDRVEREAPPREDRRDEMAFDRLEREVRSRNEQHVVDVLEGEERYDGQNGAAYGRSDVRHVVEERDHDAPQDRVRHAEQVHGNPGRDAESDVDARDREEIASDCALDRTCDGHGRLLVLERWQHAHELTHEKIARREDEVKQDGGRAGRDDDILSAGQHATHETGRSRDDLWRSLLLCFDRGQRLDLARRRSSPVPPTCETYESLRST